MNTLIEYKADVNHISKDNWTALRLAKEYQHADVVNILIQYITK